MFNIFLYINKNTNKASTLFALVSLMGIEIFDDSAFYWFATTIFSITLIPCTAYTGLTSLRSMRKTECVCKCTFCVRQSGKKKKSPKFSKISAVKVAIFLFLWILFFKTISLLDFKSKSNQSFDPYFIFSLFLYIFLVFLLFL